MDRDFSKAVSFMWNRKDRHLLRELHNDVYAAVQKSGLERLYRLSTLAFAWPGQPREGLQILADGAKHAGDEFPLRELTLQCLRSFAPVKWPSREQLQEARRIWSGGLAKAREMKETRQDRAVKLDDYCRFQPKMSSITMWRRWQEGLIDLAAGDVVKVVTAPKDGMCHVNKPGRCPVIATMELVDVDWLEPPNGNFKECDYCAAIDHETSHCPYRGKVPYGWKGIGPWRVEGGKMFFD
jgi:hypothetical protein